MSGRRSNTRSAAPTERAPSKARGRAPSTEPRPPEVICIGGSAGSIEALLRILPELPAEFPWPIAVVVHQQPGQPSLLEELFRGRCRLGVWEAQHGCPLRPGIFFGPPDYHLSVERDRTLSLSTEPSVRYSRPSIDVLFESAVWTYGAAVLAILLSGANEDGARGLRKVRDAGGLVWVQSPASALVTTMPEAGSVVGPDASLSPEQMATKLADLVKEGQ